MELKEIFDSWAECAKRDYAQKQWLLSKWELFEGIDWPREKRDFMVKSIIKGLKIRSTHTLADFGCGGGWILHRLKVHVRRIYGVDFSKKMLGFAREASKNGNFIAGEVGKLPFKSDVFDRALSYYVFLNFTDDRYVERSLLEIIRVLKR